MKKMTRFFGTSLLVVAMSAVTLAGEVQTPGAPQHMTLPGEVPTPGLTSADPSAGTFDAVVGSAELLATWFLNSF